MMDEKLRYCTVETHGVEKTLKVQLLLSRVFGKENVHTLKRKDSSLRVTHFWATDEEFLYVNRLLEEDELESLNEDYFEMLEMC